jgi:arginine/ornithine transport system substrate-binding protein
VVSCSCVDLTTSSRLDAQRFINAFQFDVGASPGPYAVEGWDAGNAFVDAIRAGAITRQRVTAELAGRRRYAGLAGTYAFGADGELRPRSAPIRFYRAEGGRWISLGSEDASTPFDLATPGVLTVGSCRGGPPYAFRRHGALRGFDVAVAREIARRMRLRLAWRPVACAAVHGAIEHRRIDVLTGAGRPLPRGAEGTRIYLSVREGLVTTSRQGIGGPADLRSRDRVGVVRGSTAERWARRDLTPRGVAVAAVGSPRRALRLLRRGRLDAALVDESLARARSRGSALRMVANVDAGDYRVLAVSRDDPGLLASVDAEVARLVSGRRYRALFRRWFPGVAVPPETGSP